MIPHVWKPEESNTGCDMYANGYIQCDMGCIKNIFKTSMLRKGRTVQRPQMT